MVRLVGTYFFDKNNKIHYQNFKFFYRTTEEPKTRKTENNLNIDSDLAKRMNRLQVKQLTTR